VAEGMTATAVFTLFVRRLPEHRNVLLACGFESVLASLEQLRFSDDDLAYLRWLKTSSDDFLTWLLGFTFAGEAWLHGRLSYSLLRRRKSASS